MSQDFDDDTGKTWTPSDSDQITTSDEYKFGAQSFLPQNLGGISTAASTDFETGTGNFTWEGWFKWTDAAGGWFYMDQDVGGTGEDIFEWYIGRNGKVECWGNQHGDYSDYFSIYIDDSSWPSLSLNTWYHIATERIGDDGVTFINGVAQTMSNQFAAAAAVHYKNTPLLLGYQSYSNLYVDEIRFSNIARYDAGGFTPSTDPFDLDANTMILLHFEPATLTYITGVKIQAYNY